MRVGVVLGVGAVLVIVTITALVITLSARLAPGHPPSSPPVPARTPPRPPSAPEQKRPAPPAAGERTAERLKMVERQIAHPRDIRTRIENEAVLDAMRAAPRHVFVPRSRQSRAYQDSALPIGYGQTISQPYIVALMTELLALDGDDRVLEIGTGSGYQAAVLAHLMPDVYTVEIIEPLFARAGRVLSEQGYGGVHLRHADGYFGWAEHAPFDAIIVTCAAGHLPPPLWEQLKPGGRIVIPIGGPYEVQRLVVVTKDPDGSRRSRTVTSVRFVPMTRGEQP
ncbi:MAG: protein-L-isoaspartate(D-aspartate) O-methyltransferase [Planctomycetota bacterium]